MEKYQTDPVGYANDILDATLTPDQEEILRSLVTHRRTAVKASHAIGKTFVAAIAACWWYDCWPDHIVYITAPTWSQCLGLTFKQIKLLRRQHRLPGRILETGKVVDEDPEHEPGHFIKSLNAESGEGFQGEHTSAILLIYEESVGVPGYIWEAGDGLMTHPDCRLLAIANPTDESTPFGLACASPLFRVISVNGMTHPNIVAELSGQTPPFPKAIRLQWVQEMVAKECDRASTLEADAFEFPPGSGQLYQPNAIFQGRVLGEFPSQADCQVIPRGWLMNLPSLDIGATPRLGVDVARYGSDRTTIAAESAGSLLMLKEVRQMSLASVTGAIILAAQQIGAQMQWNPKRIAICIDVTGGLGAGPYDFLLERGYAAIGVNSSGKPRDKESFVNKRSELWWNTRERAREKDLDISRLPTEIRDRLIRELATPTWKPDSAGRKIVEPKADIKKRLGESPDLADAVNLAFYGAAEGWMQTETADEMPFESERVESIFAGGRL